MKELIRVSLKLLMLLASIIIMNGVLCGCKSKKSLVQTEEQRTEIQAISKDYIERIIESDILQKFQNHAIEHTDTEISLTIYDTDQPPDSLTGERPIMAIATIKQTTKAEQTENCDVSAHEESREAITSTAEYNATDSVCSSVQTESERGSDRTVWNKIIIILCCIGVILLLVAIIIFKVK